MAALYEELARCIRIFGSFAGGKKTANGKKTFRRRQIETVEQIPDLETTRKAAGLLVPRFEREERQNQSMFR